MTIHKRARLTPIQRQEIFNKYYQGSRICDLVRQYSTSRPTVYKIVHRGRHNDFTIHKSINKRFRCVEYGLKREEEEEFVEVSPGVNVELDENGQVIGVEILNASRLLKPVVKPFQKQTLEPALR